MEGRSPDAAGDDAAELMEELGRQDLEIERLIDAETAPQATKMPPLFRQALREKMPSRCWGAFDELCAWEDDIVDALNIVSTAADRMAAALEAIEDTPYGNFESKGDYAAFIRDLAHNGRFPK